MTSSSYASTYWHYLKAVCPDLEPDVLSQVALMLERTNWETPDSAIDWNNCAVLALVEAEQCQEEELRFACLRLASEALNNGIEHPLCAAHLALISCMIGDKESSSQAAFSQLIDTLRPAHSSNQTLLTGLIYLPSASTHQLKYQYALFSQTLGAKDGYRQALLLLTEVACRSNLVFYNSEGLRLLEVQSRLSPDLPITCLKLGIAKLMKGQAEGLLYLHQAQHLVSNSSPVLQSLYLAYKTLGNDESARLWLDTARSVHPETKEASWQWTQLEPDSLFTYTPFDDEILLAVEPSFRSIVTGVLLAEGDWFEQEIEFWRNQIQPGMTVIDVGANVGVYTFSAAHRVGSQGRVLAIEPFSGCIRCLRETCRVNQFSWVTVCPGAASDRIGKGSLSLQAASEFNQILSDDSQSSESTEQIDCFTLDSLVESEQIDRVDFLKIDAEGHELQVLQGSDRILKDFRPVVLYENIAGRAGSNLPVANLLQAYGYQLFRYQPYVQQLLPIDSIETLQRALNVIAIPVDASAEPLQVNQFSSPILYAPSVQAFHSDHYLRHNQRRLEHLASLGLNIAGATVLEVGAGIGDHTHFFLDRGCQVVSTEGRQENFEILRDRYPQLEVKQLDVDNPAVNFERTFDIVYCYGLLYHLQQPARALEFMARHCSSLLLLETAVSPKQDESINLRSEPAESRTQSISGQGCRPSRRWIYHQLKQQFEFVYMPVTQPNHEEFPIDWTADLSQQEYVRAVFIASRKPLQNPLLVEEIPMYQKRD